jgi:hypothetical protein
MVLIVFVPLLFEAEGFGAVRFAGGLLAPPPESVLVAEAEYSRSSVESIPASFHAFLRFSLWNHLW